MTRTTQWLYGWLLLLPAMALLVLFTHYPAVATFWQSFFTTPKGSRPVVFAGTPVPSTLCCAISSMRTRHIARGRYCGCGTTWQVEQLFLTVSTKPASGSESGLPSRPRIGVSSGEGVCAPAPARNEKTSRGSETRLEVTERVYNGIGTEPPRARPRVRVSLER